MVRRRKISQYKKQLSALRNEYRKHLIFMKKIFSLI